MKVTTSKKAPLSITFGSLPAIGATFRCGGMYYMNIQTVALLDEEGFDLDVTINAVCLNNGKLAYIQPGDLIEVVEAELVVITND
jgi:hypothetical protein